MIGPGALCALGALCLAEAIQLNNGAYEPRALALATAATLLALAAALWLRFAKVAAERALVAQCLLGLGVAAGLARHVLQRPTAYGDEAALRGFHWTGAAALVVFCASLVPGVRAWLAKARFLLLLGCFAAMGVMVLRASPRPWIDVWVFQEGASAALLAGHNPYNVSFPNIYGNLTSVMYAPELVINNRVIAFPYTPLTVLFDLPFHALFGDVRVMLLLSMLAAAWALARACPGPSGELAGLFVLFQPRSFFVLEQAWTEPLILAVLGFALWAIRREKHWSIIGLAMGLLAASKQYSPLIVLPLFMTVPSPARKNAALLAAAVLAVTILPFAVLAPHGFWLGVVKMQILQPFRIESLSLLVPYARRFGVPSWGAAGAFVAAFVTLALTVRRRLSAAQSLTASAAAWIVFVLLNKQAFCNYDWLGAALLCGAAAATAE